MIFFTADTHFNHKNIIKYCNRPFESVEGMNLHMIDRWNSVVGQTDTVYHLGDFGFFKNSEDVHNMLINLNGNIVLVVGNHDDKKVTKSLGWDKIIDGFAEFRFPYDCGNDATESQKVVLCHYPMQVWNGSNFGSLMLHGHCHGTLESSKNRVDVGVDRWDFAPVTLDQILIRQFQKFGF